VQLFAVLQPAQYIADDFLIYVKIRDVAADIFVAAIA